MKFCGVWLAVVGVLASVPTSGWSADADARLERLRQDLEFLAGPACEGRGLGTAGIDKAADYIAAAFQKAGLQPPAAYKDFFQPFSMKGPATLGTPNHLHLNGPKDAKLDLQLNRDFVPLGGLSAAGKLAVPVVFVGYGLSVTGKDPKSGAEIKYDDYAGVDVAGKIVIVLRQTPRTGNREQPFPFDPSGQRTGSLVNKLVTAEKHKAAGVLFVSDTAKAGKNDDLLDFNMLAEDSAVTNLPAVHVKRALVDQLLTASQLPPLAELEKKIDADLKPQSAALSAWTADLELTITRKKLPTKNVVGILDGAGPHANETVIIGAHYDHLGFGGRASLASDRKPTIHFGADDNGSGTAALLELARHFGALKNRQGRRLVFLAFSGEESGLIGSAHYVNKEPLFPLESTAAMLNLDMVGRLSPDRTTKKDKLEIYGTGTAKHFDKLVDDLTAPLGLEIKKIAGGMGPSDHASFYAKQIPVLFFCTGTHPDYHKPSDTPDKVNYAGVSKIVELTAALASKISGADERPAYVKVAGGGVDLSGSRVSVPRIGFMPGDYSESEEKGVLVGGVTKNGPAEKGGIQEGDFIIAVGDKPIKNMAGYMAAMGAHKPGDTIEMTVERKGKKVTLKVVPQ
jgi:hypothetical protein